MGLFWYSAQKYRDFVLELEFTCSRTETNSGVFLRVPRVPVNNDYIYHSFEIQIDDASKEIHHTGAAYDAELPKPTHQNPQEKGTSSSSHFWENASRWSSMVLRSWTGKRNPGER